METALAGASGVGLERAGWPGAPHALSPHLPPHTWRTVPLRGPQNCRLQIELRLLKTFGSRVSNQLLFWVQHFLLFEPDALGEVSRVPSSFWRELCTSLDARNRAWCWGTSSRGSWSWTALDENVHHGNSWNSYSQQHELLCSHRTFSLFQESAAGERESERFRRETSIICGWNAPGFPAQGSSLFHGPRALDTRKSFLFLT